jgi:uncharacterized protein YfaS (alpha-2-macroglobulin family)
LAPEVLTRGGGVDKMVAHGIERVLSMQTPSGGLGYWPGSRSPSAWGTAYATHMLLDARNAGFSVPQARLNEIISWIETKLDNTDHGHRYAEGYLHYVLARVGRGRKGRLVELAQAIPTTPTGRQIEQAYLIKAALYLAGDRRFEADLKALDVSTLSDERQTGWSFYSDRRRRGFALSIFVDLFGADAAGEKALEQVAKALAGSSARYTTQELVWGVTALGKWMQDKASDFTPPRLLVDGKAPPAKSAAKRPDRSWVVQRASERRAVNLEVPAQEGEGAVWLILGSEGVRAGVEPKAVAEGLKVDRAWVNSDGDDIDAAEVELGQLIYSRIRLSNTTQQRVDNIALVDRFPAGWEVENPRLGRGALPDWVNADALWKPDHMDIRDDRVQVFGGLDKGETVEVLYALRAVAAGTFTAPPIEAEAMYDPRLRARALGEKVTVAGPWEALLD